MMLADMKQTGYLRYPTIAGDRIIFVAEDDLWTITDAGGVARRLTTALSVATHPRISPDGKQIAFVAGEDGPHELYVMPVEGGAPTKLTHLGAMTVTSGWHPDGHILFTSDADAPFSGWRFPYRISPKGGEPEAFPWGPAQDVAVSPGGGIVIGRNVRDAAYWKRYRGGTVGHFWVDPDGKSGFTRWEGPNGNLGSPMWVAGRVYFLSDHEGIGNLYSAFPDGTDIRRHTDHETYYARNAQTDGRRIVYHAGGDIYLYDPDADSSRLIPIELQSSRTQKSRRFVEAARYLENVDVHPDGHSVLATVRGRAYSFGNWEGAVFEHGEAMGVRYRMASWLPDGNRFVTVKGTDETETLEIHDASGHTEPSRVDCADIGRVVSLAVSPKGERVAIANHRNQLLVVELEGGEQFEVEENPYGRLTGLTWSPDGNWLAYSAPFTRQTMGLKLWRTGEEPVCITRPVLADTSPSFDPTGKYLYFLSYRVFNPVYDDLQFNLGFVHGVKPCLITLQSDTPSPFLPEPRPVVDNNRPADAGPKQNGAEGDDDMPQEEETAMAIDLDGIADRVLMFPVPEARYTAVVGIHGKAMFLSQPATGAVDSGGGPKGTLHAYDLRELKHETLAQGVTGFAFSFDRKTALLRYDRRVRVLQAGKKPEDKPSGQGAEAHGRESGWVHLARIKAAVYPEQEWAQMLREAWSLQREHFWTEDLSGVDWDAVWTRYSRLLPRIATRSDLSDLMWEMQGELGTSHAYEMGGDYRQGPKYGQGFLGARFRWDPKRDGYRITAVVKGDSWADDSSLRLPGVRLAVGDVIVAINNQRLTHEVSPAVCLVGKAGQEVALRVVSADGDVRIVTVKALNREQELRAQYRAWVESNRRKVREASEGRLGYVHVPDMMGTGFAEFHRSWLTESEREGLIVDVRHNRGGHVSALLLEKLSRRAVGFSVSRWGPPQTYPHYAVLGPIVAITNERAGSDGDIFSHAFKLMKLGPLVGKRTWGGVIGIWPRHPLVDGSVTTQPEFAYWFTDVGWGVENYGTDPDIDVDDRPEDYGLGVDAQLDRAIQEAMARLEADPPVWPAFDERPTRTLPELPTRTQDGDKGETAG